MYRWNEFSVQLQTHVETLQNMAIIKSIKTGRNERKGKSTKTIKEEWEKRQRCQIKGLENTKSQKTKEFSANGLEKKGRKGKISANLSDKASIYNSDKYTFAKLRIYTRLPIVFVPSQMLHYFD